MAPSDEIRKKQVNHARLQWHEFVLRDRQVRKRPHALALAGHLMHRFNPENGFAEVSIATAAKALDATERSIERAFAFLIARGWITLREAYSPRQFRWSANRYALAYGPDELEPTLHESNDHLDTADATRVSEG